MIPTLLVGDFILVNKFTYGIRLPVVNLKVIEMNQPRRGEVMVFRYPDNPSLDYIKRVVGLPGDVVTYRDKQLTINGQSVATEAQSDFEAPRGPEHRFGEALPWCSTSMTTLFWSTRRSRRSSSSGCVSSLSGRTVNTMTRASPARSRRATIS
jgi:hypothetical protein